MIEDQNQRRLKMLTNIVSDYCHTLENAGEMDKQQFIAAMVDYLPRIYWEFVNFPPMEDSSLDYGYLTDYVDEDYYNRIRMRLEQLFGPDDTYLETFEEDMKYSDTPIGASISESLADIFQELYNYLAAVKEADDTQIITVFNECKENFIAYWSQTLCNVMRPLNHLMFNPTDN